MLCRRPSSSSIRDRGEVVVTTTLRRRRASTFAMPVRTLDPEGFLVCLRAHRSPRHHQATAGATCTVVLFMGTSVSAAVATAWRKAPDDDRFTCVAGAGLRILLLRCQDTRGIGVADG